MLLDRGKKRRTYLFVPWFQLLKQTKIKGPSKLILIMNENSPENMKNVWQSEILKKIMIKITKSAPRSYRFRIGSWHVCVGDVSQLYVWFFTCKHSTVRFIRIWLFTFYFHLGKIRRIFLREITKSEVILTKFQ